MRRDTTLLPKAALALAVIGCFTAVINVLSLTGAVYILQLYDRVLTSYSLPTLIVLSAIAGVLYITYGILVALRGTFTVRLADRLLARNAAWALAETARSAGQTGGKHAVVEKTPAEDLEAMAQAIRGGGVAAMLDGSWALFYIFVLGLIDLWLGVFAALAALGFVVLSLAAVSFRMPAPQPTEDDSVRWVWRMALRSAGTYMPAASLEALARLIAAARGRAREEDRERQEGESARRGGATTMRNIAQSGVLAIGAWLVIADQATLGVMMASAILMGRILGPIETVLYERRALGEGFVGWKRLKKLKQAGIRAPKRSTRQDEEGLRGDLKVNRIAAGPTPQAPTTFSEVSFELEAGQLLLVVGQSGAGKSLLLRTLAGLHAQAQGRITFGGTRMADLDAPVRERLIGYLPQESVFLPGTVAEAIARYDTNVTRAEVVEAAKRAGAHDRISNLARGYDTPLPPNGPPLPFGTMRFIALARALCRDPHLLVLDDPLAGLHPAAFKFVTDVIAEKKRAGGIVVLTGQPPNFREVTDRVLVLAQGRMQSFGAPAEVFKPRRVVMSAAAGNLRTEGDEHA
jgi:ATP-binding cassette subfamily C protein